MDPCPAEPRGSAGEFEGTDWIGKQEGAGNYGDPDDGLL